MCISYAIHVIQSPYPNHLLYWVLTGLLYLSHHLPVPKPFGTPRPGTKQRGKAPVPRSPLQLFKLASAKPAYPASSIPYLWNHSEGSFPVSPSLPLSLNWSWCFPLGHCVTWHSLSFRWQSSPGLLAWIIIKSTFKTKRTSPRDTEKLKITGSCICQPSTYKYNSCWDLSKTFTQSRLCIPRHKAWCLVRRMNNNLGASSWYSNLRSQYKSDTDILNKSGQDPFLLPITPFSSHFRLVCKMLNGSKDASTGKRIRLEPSELSPELCLYSQLPLWGWGASGRDEGRERGWSHSLSTRPTPPNHMDWPRVLEERYKCFVWVSLEILSLISIPLAPST